MIRTVSRVVIATCALALTASGALAAPAVAANFEVRGGCTSSSLPILYSGDISSTTTYVGVSDDVTSWAKNTSGTKHHARNILWNGLEETLFAVGGNAADYVNACGQPYDDKTDHFEKA